MKAKPAKPLSEMQILCLQNVRMDPPPRPLTPCVNAAAVDDRTDSQQNAGSTMPLTQQLRPSGLPYSQGFIVDVDATS